MCERITVAIPVYNVERYLNRCVESIVNQTYSNLQILLIDDGSPDHCPEMCDEWAKRDNRIEVIHKKNAGLGEARNTGIENATGKYICFVDSDDFLELSAIEHVYAKANSEDADITCFGMSCLDAQGRIVDRIVPNVPKSVYRDQEIKNELLEMFLGANPETGEDYRIPISACCKLFSMRCIQKNNWRFVSEEKIISEDFYSLLLLFRDVETVCVVPNAYYNYCYNNASLTHVYRTDRFEKICLFYLESIKICDEMLYPKGMISRLSGIFLAFVVVAMKQEMAADISLRDRSASIRRMLEDRLLQKVLQERKHDKVNLKKKILYWVMRHKLCFLCCFLLAVQNKFGESGE